MLKKPNHLRKHKLTIRVSEAEEHRIRRNYEKEGSAYPGFSSWARARLVFREPNKVIDFLVKIGAIDGDNPAVKEALGKL